VRSVGGGSAPYKAPYFDLNAIAAPLHIRYFKAHYCSVAPLQFFSINMKAIFLFAGLAAAHSGVWTITFDGNKYVYAFDFAQI
jgi:hypothetical protein